MTKVPIACTLTVEDAGTRIDEWRAFFAEHTDAVDRRDAAAASVRLRPAAEALVAAADLAERESVCCSFFGFSLALRDQRWWLEIAVPDDAAPVLADFVALAG